MGLYDEVSPNVHNVGLIDYMMEVLLGMYEVIFTCLVDVWNELCACRLLIGLLSMFEVMGLHMYIALVDLDWGCD